MIVYRGGNFGGFHHRKGEEKKMFEKRMRGMQKILGMNNMKRQIEYVKSYYD